MDLSELAEHFPNLWHVTFAGGWDGIQRQGLLRAVDVAPKEADAFRPEVQRVEGADGLAVTLRDQVLSRSDPAPYLDGITPAQWWSLINGRVYFFRKKEDATDLLDVYLGKGHAQEVVRVRTKAALEAVAGQVEVTTVNAGTFPRTKGPSRGPATFIPLADYPAAAVAKIQEVTVTVKVPLASPAVFSVVGHDAGKASTRLFP